MRRMHARWAAGLWLLWPASVLAQPAPPQSAGAAQERSASAPEAGAAPAGEAAAGEPGAATAAATPSVAEGGDAADATHVESSSTPAESSAAGAASEPTSPPAAGPSPQDGTSSAAPYPRVKIGGRVMAGVERVRAQIKSTDVSGIPESEREFLDETRQPFFLDQSRFKVSASLTKRTRVSLSADVERKPAIRSAYVEVRLERWLRIRAGRFKRPFSELDNTSRGDLPFRNRGVFNAALMEGSGWGDRALGLMVWGKAKRPKLKWQAAIMNSAAHVDVAFSEQLRGFDLLGKLSYEPTRWLSTDVHAGYKKAQGTRNFTLDDGSTTVESPRLDLGGAGVGARVDTQGVVCAVEGNLAENLYPPGVRLTADQVEAGSSVDVSQGNRPAPLAAGVIGYVTYDIALLPELVLQPVVLGEWADTDTEYSQDETARFVVGVNLLWEEHVRVMPQVELIRPLGTEGERSLPASDRFYVLLSGEI